MLLDTFNTSNSPFYYRVTLHRGDAIATVEAIWMERLPLVQDASEQVIVLSSSEGASADAGLYVNDGQRWRFVIPYPDITNSIVNAGTIDVFYQMDVDYTGLSPSAKIWRNGLPYDTDTTIKAGNYVWGSITPLAISTGSVTSVNGQSPDGSGNVQINIANIPNLQTTLDSKGEVKTVNGVAPDGSGNVDTALPIASTTVLGGIKVGQNLTINATTGVLDATDTGITSVTNVGVGGVPVVQSDGSADKAATLRSISAGNSTTVALDAGNNAVQIDVKIASTTQLGVVKQGTNITIAADGTISATAAPYTLPKTTTTVLGGMIVGDNLTVDANGRVSGAPAYTLPIATTSVLGGIIVGSGLAITAGGVLSSSITQGVMSVTSVGTGVAWVADDGSTNSQAKIKSVKVGSNMTLTTGDAGNSLVFDALVPVQSVNTLTGAVTIQAVDTSAATGVTLISDSGGVTGQIKIKRLVAGTGITLANDASGNLVITSGGGYTLPAATAGTLGGVKIGTNVNVTADGTISVAAPYTLIPATTTTLGGVIVGSRLTVDGTGLVNVPIATGSVLGVVRAGTGLQVDGSGVMSVTATGGVSSVNTKTGAVTITGGTNITVDNTGTSILISSSGIPDAPIDGSLYARKNQAWAVIPDVTNALIEVNSAGSGGSTSLVFNPSVNNTAQLKGLISGTGVSITDDGAGNLTIAASSNGYVQSVNSKTPDASGAVTITAADVGAVSKAGDAMLGALNMNNNSLTGVPTPLQPSDAVPLSYMTSLTIDNGEY